MAEGSDPSINKNEGLPAQVHRTNLNPSIQQQRPSYRNNVWTRQPSNEVIRHAVPPGGILSPPTGSNKKFSFISNVTKSFGRSNSYQDEDPRKSAVPPVEPQRSHFINQGPQAASIRPQNPQVYVFEQSTKPYWEGDENTYGDQSSQQFDSYPDENYGTESASNQYPEEYSDFQKAYKKKGISVKIDRFVQRFPALSKLYKQPTSPSDRYEGQPGADYGESFDSTYANQLERDLTAEELALPVRYSDKARSQFIDLQTKDKTQPVDICVHSETNKIYLCDIGRCLVEIYDSKGALLHVIDNPTMMKFQPSAIAVTADGTIIVASYFSHCLHMYSPTPLQPEAKSYSYKQFKLGAPGNQLHQFHHPAGISVDTTDDYLYVCDRGNYRIQVFRPEGLCERVIELFLNEKKKVPVEPNRVVPLQHSDQLVCIVSPGDSICFIPKRTNGRLQIDPLYICAEDGVGLEGASGIAVDANDRIFISDTYHNRIVICSPDGSCIATFGTEGDGLCQLRRPCGLNITNDGTVVVTDSGNKRIQLFGVLGEQAPSENNLPQGNPNQINTSLVSIEQLSTQNNSFSETVNEHMTSAVPTEQTPVEESLLKESVRNTNVPLLSLGQSFAKHSLPKESFSDIRVLSAIVEQVRSEDDLWKEQLDDSNALSTVSEHPPTEDNHGKEDYNKTINLLFNANDEDDLTATL